MLALVLAATLSAHDYATMPVPSGPQWSPDGKRIAYVLTRADLERSAYNSDVWLITADGKRNLQLTHRDASDNSPRWSPDGTRLAFLSEREGKASIFLIDPAGGEPQRLTSEPMPVRELLWSPDGKQIAFTRLDEPTADEERRAKEKDDARVVGEQTKHAHLYLVDVASGKVRRLTSGPFSIFRFTWSPDAKAIAFDRGPGVALDDYYRTDIYTVSVADGVIRPLVVRAGLDRAPVWAPDGKSIAFLSTGGVHDWLLEHQIHVVPASGGAPLLVSKEYGRTPESISWSEDSSTIWFHGPLDSTSQIFRVKVDGSRLTPVSNLAGVVNDLHVRENVATYIYETLTEPPELYVEGRRATSHNAAFRDRELGETRLIRWKNPKDGLPIEGLLTLPVGYSAGSRVPLITFVHGGPASRFDQGFLGYLGHLYPPHAFAARGFAVLRPNPRGTGGYGGPFRQANRNDWGGMDWADVNAGIDLLIADGIADPSRLGLMGWSYGGFLASWAIGHSDRFRAISVGAPVVDLLSFHGTTDIRDFLPHYFDRREDPIAATVDELRHAPLSLELLRAHSPIWHLKKTNARVLIQHGEADDRVPLSQGTMLYRILDELGVDVTLVTYPRSPHTPREPKLRIDVATRNLELFERMRP